MTGTEFLSDVILPQLRTRLQLARNDPVGKNAADTVSDCVIMGCGHTS